MDAERWRQVQELFHAVLEAPGGERAERLSAAGAEDPELVAEVEALLRAHHEAPSYVDRPAFRLLGDAEGEPLREVGAYQVQELLGHGGMGVVYRAVRADDTFDKQVAIKVIGGDLATPELMRRFQIERQILADLEHPGIARLLDGGTTADGRPFLVMEHVQGRPIDVYAREEKLGIDACIDLFVEVCDAVHAAHRNLVVHRDLKPANILVDDDGRPRLLDFGIAKLLRPDGERPAPGLTGPASRLMTPPYASPEQVRGLAVSTASDVYALGVLLFELLTGEHPFADCEHVPHELAAAILEKPPPSPSSAVLGRGTGDPPGVLRRRARKLAGDLDRIVAQTLRKEPERRYASAEALAADLRRYRRGLPVAARADTLGYRAGKFVRRHRLAVAASVATVAALLALTATALVQRAQMVLQRDRAEDVSGFLEQLFQQADPRHNRGAEVTARELLDRGVEELGRLQRSPDTRAAILATMGAAYAGLGRYDDAGDLQEEALELRQQTHGRRHREVADSHAALGRLHLVKGDLELAEEHFRAALALRRELLGERRPQTATSYSELGSALHRRGVLDEAEASYVRAVEILRSLPEEREELAHALNRFVSLLRDHGRFADAEVLQREALDLLESVHGPAPDPAVARFRSDLATLLRRRGEDVEAEALYRRVLDTQRTLYPDGHPDVATTLTHLASVATRGQRWEEAEALYEEALALRRRLLGAEHPLVANTLNNQGLLAEDRGDLDRAEELYREAMRLQEASLPSGHHDLAGTRSNLGWVLARRDRHAEAEAFYRQALDAYRELYGERHVRVGAVLNNLADSLKVRRRHQEAGELFEEAVDILRAALGDDHVNLAAPLSNLAGIYQVEGRLDEAAAAYDEAYDIVARRLGADHGSTLRIDLNRALLAAKMPHDAELEQRVRELLARCESALPPGHPYSAEARGLLGELLLERGEQRQAAELIERSLRELSSSETASSTALAAARRRAEELERRAFSVPPLN